MKNIDSEATDDAKRIIEIGYLTSDTHASPKHKQRAKAALCYWATELERMVSEGRTRPYNRPKQWENVDS